MVGNKTVFLMFFLHNYLLSSWLLAMSLKESGKLLESKVYDTLQLQVNHAAFFLNSFPYLSLKLYAKIIT